MKTVHKRDSSIVYFLTFAVLSAITVILIQYYIPFIKQTAGTYNIIVILGEPLRDFLIKLLLPVAGILAFLTFLIKFKKAPNGKKLYPFYMIGMGALWIVLPFLSAYTISRFTGDLILQTVSGIAIIANVVFMMISVCCGIIAAIDCIHNLFLNGENNVRANQCAALLAGIPTGCGFALLLTSALQPSIGLSGVFIVFGAVAAISGIFAARIV